MALRVQSLFFLVFVYIVLLSRVKAKNISFGEALRFVGPDGDPDSESQWVTCLLCQIHVFIFLAFCPRQTHGHSLNRGQRLCKNSTLDFEAYSCNRQIYTQHTAGSHLVRYLPGEIAIDRFRALQNSRRVCICLNAFCIQFT